MATLTGLFISQSYGGVIHLSTNTSIVTGSSTQLQDGFGTNLGVFLNGLGGISGSAITSSADSLINSVTIGKGGGNISDNTAVGFQALNSNTAGLANTAVGYRAGSDTAGGQHGVYIGYDAGKSNASGGRNSIVGAMAHYSNILSTDNVVIGYRAAYSNTDGTGNNVIIGSEAHYDGTTSSGNTIVGYNTGRGVTTGDFNTILGANVTGLSSSLSNNIILADGQGNIRARYSGSWTLDGVVNTTASYANNATTASYALNAATAASFPFSGSAQITGSLGITGSISSLVKVLTISSQTASMDFDAADMFTLTLVSGSNTFINPTNVRAGRTAALQVTQAAVSNGTVTFPSSVTFANNVSGSSATSSAYVPSPGTGSVDIVTFACFSGSILRATPINLFLPVS